jgi:hypothetical protein
MLEKSTMSNFSWVREVRLTWLVSNIPKDDAAEITDLFE